MAHKFIRDLAIGEKVNGYYVVRSKRKKLTRTNKPFIDLDLGDISGQLNAKLWDRVEEFEKLFSRGDVIKIQASVEEYQGAKQLKIISLMPTHDGDDFNPADLIKQSPYKAEEQVAFLEAQIEAVTPGPIQALLKAFFADPDFVAAFRQAPAARNLHHAYAGGLVEHTVKVTKTALFAADQLYPGEVDRDLLIAGAILHDVGKIEELEGGAEVSNTRAGYLLGHITLGVAMLLARARRVKDFPPDVLVELEHIILSHHGEREWGSPITPMTPEAMIVHIADNLDAKTFMVIASIDEDPNEDEEFTQYHRTLARHLFKSPRRPRKPTPKPA